MGAGCCKEEEIDFNAEVELLHFHLLRSVGKGAFGKVRVVQHKQSKILYALKYINKEKCIKMRAIENIIQERRLLEEIEHSLICNLRYAFQDDENMFMVLDLMLGGDLRFHLERQGNMKEEVVKFYVAEISLGLAYLHSRKIVHRDLKPDNVLLDEKGHAHLTDFNIAVHYNEKKPLTSIAGSMAYMAPEILKKRGYFNSVDWWSLGVVMYELLFSKRPFRGKTNQALTQAILHESLRFPDNAKEHVSGDCIDVLKRFCERDINKRLGCNGIDEIKQHPWFSNIEWDKLYTKQANPPFVPDSKRANFDATHELEELLLEDNPLKAKKRANPNQILSELSKEVRMMEEKFLIYDFSKMSRKSYYKYSPESINTQEITKQNSISNNSSATMVNTDNRSLSTMISSHERHESDVTAVTSTEYKTKNEMLTSDFQTKPSFEIDNNGNKNSHKKSMSSKNNETEGYRLKPSSSAQDINKKSTPMTHLSTAHTKSSSLTLPYVNYHNNNSYRNYNNNNNNNNNDNRPPMSLIPLQLLSVNTTNASQLIPSQSAKNSPNDLLSQRSNSRSQSPLPSPSTSSSPSPSSSPLPSPQILPSNFSSKSSLNVFSSPPLPPPNSPLPLPPTTLQQQQLYHQNISSHAVNNNNHNLRNYPSELNDVHKNNKIHYRDENDIVMLAKNQYY